LPGHRTHCLQAQFGMTLSRTNFLAGPFTGSTV
jgi:hypothetical protein